METTTSMNKKHKCKVCNSLFNSWEFFQQCQHCDDGIKYNPKDSDINGDESNYIKCFMCNGTGEASEIQTEFCSEQCIYEEEQSN